MKFIIETYSNQTLDRLATPQAEVYIRPESINNQLFLLKPDLIYCNKIINDKIQKKYQT